MASDASPLIEVRIGTTSEQSIESDARRVKPGGFGARRLHLVEAPDHVLGLAMGRVEEGSLPRSMI